MGRNSSNRHLVLIIVLQHMLLWVWRAPIVHKVARVGPNTDDNGNAMFQSYLCKLFKKETR